MAIFCKFTSSKNNCPIIRRADKITTVLAETPDYYGDEVEESLRDNRARVYYEDGTSEVVEESVDEIYEILTKGCITVDSSILIETEEPTT